MSAPLFGPWERRFWEIYDSKGNRVCDVMQHGNLDERCDLIAAAPELLEALSNMTALAHAYVGDDPKGLALVAKATAAIFKAQGRQ